MVKAGLSRIVAVLAAMLLLLTPALWNGFISVSDDASAAAYSERLSLGLSGEQCSAIACHLMNFAYWHGASFKWDPAKHEFVSGGDAKWLTREYRGEFKV